MPFAAYCDLPRHDVVHCKCIVLAAIGLALSLHSRVGGQCNVHREFRGYRTSYAKPKPKRRSQPLPRRRYKAAERGPAHGRLSCGMRPGGPGSCCNLALGGHTNRGGAGLKPSAGRRRRLVSRAQRSEVVTAGTLPPVVRDISIFRN